MARKPVSTPPQAAAPAADPRRRAVDALMKLAVERRWDEIELPDIATEAGLTLAQLRGLFPSSSPCWAA